jgi:hypothetical protein
VALAIDKTRWCVRGGIAWPDSEYSLKLCSPSTLLRASDTRCGVEYAFARGWSAKIERNHTGLRQRGPTPIWWTVDVLGSGYSV